MDTKKLQLYFFIGLLFAVFALALTLFTPFVAPLALAFMAAIVIRPVHRWFLKVCRNRHSLAATCAVFFVMIVIMVPIALIIREVSIESYTFYTDIRDGGPGSFTVLVEHVIKPIQKVFPEFNIDIATYAKAFSDSLISNAQGIFSSTASIALAIFIAIFGLFYMLRDGREFKKTIIELSPLTDAYDRDIIEKIERAVNSVVHGSLFTSLLKGVLATLGFAICGVPHAILWGAITAVVSLLPGIGAGLTLIPAVLYLLALDSVGAAIGLTVWGVVVVGLVDNVVMPFVMGKGFRVHPLFVLLSVVGGIIVFGPIGLFLGPLVIALLSALLEIYKLIVVDDQKKKITSL